MSIGVERFKCYREWTELELGALTVIVGRNNSGKSTMIQALLLLQQTLKQTSADVSLHLEGIVDALNLRELTTGWPDAVEQWRGPVFELSWSSHIDVERFKRDTNAPDESYLKQLTGITTSAVAGKVEVTTRLRLWFSERDGRPELERFSARSMPSTFSEQESSVCGERGRAGEFEFTFDLPIGDTVTANKLEVGVDKFVPFVSIDRTKLGPKDRQRALYNAFALLFAQPLEDLSGLLESMTYLRSIREAPPSLYRPAAGKADDLGVSGEHAAKLLHARQSDLVHYPRPITVDESAAIAPTTIEERPFVDAVNDVLAHLGVPGPVRLDDIRNVGFRLLFGNATMQHVGRGLTYLLPIVEYGLITDPLRWQKSEAHTLDAYLKALEHFTLAAIEEPEAHLHPKVQSRLSHWLVALAMSGRRLIVETHSDHFVRRLRGIAARAPQGSPLEAWLRENVAIYMVEQGEDGLSAARRATLTTVGRIDAWPSDFMDEATDEERAIADAALDKTPEPATAPSFTVEHAGDEP